MVVYICSKGSKHSTLGLAVVIGDKTNLFFDQPTQKLLIGSATGEDMMEGKPEHRETYRKTIPNLKQLYRNAAFLMDTSLHIGMS